MGVLYFIVILVFIYSLLTAIHNARSLYARHSIITEIVFDWYDSGLKESPIDYNFLYSLKYYNASSYSNISCYILGSRDRIFLLGIL